MGAFLKPYSCVRILVLQILLVKCAKALEVIGVEGQTASFDFTISTKETLLIHVKHPLTDNNLLTIYSNGTVVAGDRVTTYAGTTRTRAMFTLGQLNLTDAGAYKASTSSTSNIGGQELKIIGTPPKPTITDIGTPAVGQDHGIKCNAISTSTAGISGLVMTYHWYLNNDTVSTGGRYTVKENLLNISSVEITEDDYSFQCEAWENVQAKSVKSDLHRIPPPTSPPLIGVERQSVAFDFRVITEHPVVIIVRHPSIGNLLGISGIGEISSADSRVTNYAGSTRTRVMFTLEALVLSDVGLYRATLNDIDIGHQELKIIGMPEKPTISDTGTPVVGQDHIINCSTTSTSTEGIQGLVMSYQWYRNNETISAGGRYFFNDNELTIYPVVKTDHNDVFHCEAWENVLAKSNKSNQFNIPEPDYGPTSVSLNPTTTSYMVEEGRSVPVITCSAACKPACVPHWTKTGQSGTVGTGGTLSFGQIARNESGNYQCAVSNVHGSLTSDTVVVVVKCFSSYMYQYTSFKQSYQLTWSKAADMASITEFSINNNEVNENSELRLLCRADGNPAPAITITHDVTDFVLNVTSGLENDFTKKRTECQDQGIYSCRAYNILNGNAYPTMKQNLTVRCLPRIDPQKMETKVKYGEVGRRVSFWLYLVSSPKPSGITWVHNTTTVLTAVTTTTLNASVTVDITTSSFGNYTARVIYDGSVYNFDFLLLRKQPPNPPTAFNFVVKQLLSSSLILVWISGINGGEPQVFTIQYRKVSTKKYEIISIPENLTIEAADSEYEALVSGLDGDDQYEFTIFASNVKGNSTTVGPILVNTSDVVDECTPAMSPQTYQIWIIAVAATGGLVIGVILTGLLILIILRSRVIQLRTKLTIERKSSQSGKNESNAGPAFLDIKPESALPLNQQGPLTPASVYTHLQKETGDASERNYSDLNQQETGGVTSPGSSQNKQQNQISLYEDLHAEKRDFEQQNYSDLSQSIINSNINRGESGKRVYENTRFDQ